MEVTVLGLVEEPQAPAITLIKAKDIREEVRKELMEILRGL